MRAFLFVSLFLGSGLSAAGIVQHSSLSYQGDASHSSLFQNKGGVVRRGNGVPERQQRTIAPYNGIDLRIPARLEYRTGENTSLSISADANLLAIIETRVEQGVLVISAAEGFETRSPILIVGRSPALVWAALGTGEMSIEGIDGQALALQVRGSGSLRVSGRAEQVDAAIQGSGRIEAGGLMAAVCRLQLQGAGRIHARCADRLAARLLGSGAIAVAGSPRIEGSSTLGSGRIYLE